MLAFTTEEDFDLEDLKEGSRRRRARSAAGTGSGILLRLMRDDDLERVSEFRSVVRWAADPRAFDLLRGMRGVRWAVAEASDGSLAGMVGAVPLGEAGILCHLAVRKGYRKMSLGARLSSWAVAYLRSRGAGTIRLYSTRQAEGLYRSLGFKAAEPRTVYRLEEMPRGADRLRRAREQADGYRVSTLAFGDLPELCGLDRWSYGADRSPLILATLRLHPGWGLVARDSSGRIKGYLVRSALGNTTRVGPFVAESPGVARVLLENALGAGNVSTVEVTVTAPAACPAHALLQEFGFAGCSDRLRMELGETLPFHGSGLAQYGTTPYLAT